MVSGVCCSLRAVISISIFLERLIIRTTLSSLLVIKMSFENQILTLNFIRRFLLLLRIDSLLQATIVRRIEELIVDVGYRLGLCFTRLVVLLIEIIQAVDDSILQNVFHIRNKGIWLLGALSILFDPKVFRGWLIIVAEYC